MLLDLIVISFILLFNMNQECLFNQLHENNWQLFVILVDKILLSRSTLLVLLFISKVMAAHWSSETLNWIHLSIKSPAPQPNKGDVSQQIKVKLN